jgi:hypothetical protein
MGPMTTQSLRDMAGQGPMHWRGDRTGGNDPGRSALDEDAAFSFAMGGTGNTQRQNLEQFALALHTGLKPIVGQQVSATPTRFSDANVISRIQLMIDRNNAGDCERVVKGIFAGEARGYLFEGSDNFQPDRASAAVIDKTTLRNQAAAAGQ